MKVLRTILSVTVLGVLVVGTASQANAQQDKMTLEEWQAALDACNQREAAASARISDLEQQRVALERTLLELNDIREQTRSALIEQASKAPTTFPEPLTTGDDA